MPLLVGLPLSLFILLAPIYCVIKTAKFKNRNVVIWAILALFASVPAFIAVSFLPSRRLASEKNSYSERFTEEYGKFGYVLSLIVSIGLLGYFYSNHKPLVPVLGSTWLYIHVPLGIIAYSFALAILILCIVRLPKNILFPKIIMRLQLLAVTLFFFCIISGAIWANDVWGAYWSWDPKETWSLILLVLMIIATTYLTISVPDRITGLVVASIQLAAIIFLFMTNTLLSGLHAYGGF
jgi:ABC-type transport system involved in cytochrome c biogenesis permease subunit